MYRSNLPVINHPLQKQVRPVTFELQLVKLGLTTLANIYRPPSGSVNQFLDEFSDLLALLYSQTAGKVVICGDFNCRDFCDELGDGLESFGLIQHVQEATRGENLLDLLITDIATTVTDVRASDKSFVSDHRLITAKIFTKTDKIKRVEKSVDGIYPN